MKIRHFSVSDFYFKPSYNQYVYISGFVYLLRRREHRGLPKIIISDASDLEVGNLSKRELDFGSKEKGILIFHTWTNNLVENFLNGQRTKKAHVKILASLKWRGRMWITNVLRIELLNEQGNVLHAKTVAESAIPKEFRGKI